MLNSQPLHIKKSLTVVVTVLLWVLMAALGILCVLALRELVLSLYVLSLAEVPSYGDFLLLAPQGYNQSYWRGVALMQWSTFLLAILWIAVVIGGAEYLFRNLGRSITWKFLSWAIGLELVVLIVGMLV